MSDFKHFQDYIAETRERLSEQSRVHLEDRQKIDDQLAEIDREFAAITAYEAAKTGKTPTQSTARPQRARNSSRRDELMTLIHNSDGLTRGEILERMCVKGDKVAEGSVSNALVRYTKQGVLEHEGRRYRVPVAQEAMRHAAE